MRKLLKFKLLALLWVEKRLRNVQGVFIGTTRKG